MAMPLSSCAPSEQEKAIVALEEKDIYEEDYKQALWKAIDKGDRKTVRLLLQAGMDISSMRTSQFDATPLIWSIIQKKPRIARELIRTGIDLNAENIYGNTALGDAFYHGLYGIIDDLIEAGADIHHLEQHNDTMLIIAARYGRAKYVKLFIEEGLDVNARNNHGQTPLSEALNKNHAEAARILIAAGADTTGLDTSQVQNP